MLSEGLEVPEEPALPPRLTAKCRTLIVHRDDGGYGLTLSGDRPTRVQTVKVTTGRLTTCSHACLCIGFILTLDCYRSGGGGSYRAGVRKGDVIIKVNGQQVGRYMVKNVGIYDFNM